MEDHVSTPLISDQETVNEEDSTSSLDNIRSIDSEGFDKDESLTQSSPDPNVATFINIHNRENTCRPPVYAPDSDSKQSQSPETFKTEDSKQAEGNQSSSTYDNELMKVSLIKQEDTSNFQTTTECDSCIVQDSDKENNNISDSERVEDNVTDNERGRILIESQDHGNSSIQDASLMTEKRHQDLERRLAKQEDVNQINNNMEPRHSDVFMSTTSEYNKETIYEEDSTTSLDNIRSKDSEVSDKDVSLSQSSLDPNVESMERIQFTEKTVRLPVNASDNDSKESESPESSETEGPKQAEGNHLPTTSDNKLINVSFIKQRDISDTLTTTKIESKFEINSGIVQESDKETYTVTDSERVRNSIAVNERGGIVIGSQDHENSEITEKSSIKEASQTTENQDLERRLAKQEDINQINIQMEPRHSDVVVSTSSEHNKETINEEDSTTSLDNIRSKDSEVSVKDVSLSQNSLDPNVESLERIQVTEKTVRLLVNASDNDSKESESPETSETEGPKQEEGNHIPSTSGNKLIKVSFIKQRDISDTLSTTKIESKFESNSGIVQESDKENNIVTDLERVGNSVSDNECGGIVVDSQDHENSEITEKSSIKEASQTTENQDLERRLVKQEDVNQINNQMEPRHSDFFMSTSSEQNKETINEEDSTTSLDNIRSKDSDVSDKDVSLSQSSLDPNVESMERIQVTEKTVRLPVNASDNHSKESESPETSETEGSKEAKGNHPPSTSDNKLINVSIIKQRDISDTLTTTKIESKFENNSGIVQESNKENNIVTDLERVGNSVADDERECIVINSQDLENGDMTENSLQEASQTTKNQDLGRSLAIPEEINQIHKTSKVESRQSEGHVSTPFEHDQETIYEEDSISSLDNKHSTGSEVSEKDVSLSQCSFGVYSRTFENVLARGENGHFPVNAPDNDPGQSQLLETCPTKGFKQAEGNQLSSTSNNEMRNVSFGKQGDISDILTTSKLESKLENDSGIVQDVDKENNTTTGAERVENSIDENERGCMLIDLEDLENCDISENSSIKEASLMTENRSQIEFDFMVTSTPVKCPIFRSKLGGVAVTECGHCICTHCFNHREIGLDESCNSCDKAIRSHHIEEIEEISEDLIRSLYLKIEELEENAFELKQQIKNNQEELQHKQTENERLRDEFFKTKEEMRYLKDETLQRYKTLCIEQISKLQNYQENIVPSKDIAIEELRNEVAKLSDNSIELQRQVEMCQEELEHTQTENQRLQENMIELQQQVKMCQEELEQKQTENQRLQENGFELKQQIKNNQEEIQHKQIENERLRDELFKTREEMDETLQRYKTLFVEQISKLQNYQDNIVPSKDITIEELRNEVAKLSEDIEKQTHQINKCQEEMTHERTEHQRLQEELFQTKQEVIRLSGETENLTMMNTQYLEQAHQLQNYYVQVVQSKENLIEELRNNVAEFSGCLHQKQEEAEQLKCNIENLCGEVATLKRETVSVGQLEVLPGTNLSRAILQLQHFYDRDFRIRYDITDKMEMLLQTRLESVMTELSQQPDIGDQLASVITTYASMVKENANLHRCSRTDQEKLQDLQAQLRHAKARLMAP